MSKVLFLSDMKLDNPMRGTPIHMERLLREIRTTHNMVVCAASVTPALSDIFIPYPREQGLRKLRALIHIVDTHKPDTIFTIGQVSLLAPVLLKILRGVRIVVELQGVEYVEKYAFGHIGLFHYYFWKYKSMLLLPFYDAVIAFTRRTASLYPFLKRVTIIFPGIDVERLPQAPVVPIPPFVIGYSGNTDAYQGLEHIIDATALLREKGIDARLNLVLSGDDAKIASTIQRLSDKGLNDVTTIKRNLPHHESIIEMQTASVLPVPRTPVWESVYGFPSKLPECLALGIPVVTTDVGAVPELMPELGRHAIVIPCNDITNRLAEALLKIATMTVEERQQHSNEARSYATRFSWARATTVASDVL